MKWLTKNTKEGILFLIGCAIILVEVLNVILRDKSAHPGILVLGSTLAGVAAIQGIRNGQ